MAGVAPSLRRLLGLAERHHRRALVLKEEGRFQAAYDRFLRAAKADHVGSMLELAALHERGEGTPINLPQALDWYRRAAQHGSVDGHYGAAACLIRLEKLPRGMRQWFQSASDADPAHATLLGSLLGAQSEEEDRFRLAREHLTQACASGHGGAHYLLAELVLRGLGGDPAPERAHDLYVVAAANGVAGAAFGLGSLYQQGIGCQADEDIAVEWYRRASQHGHVPGQLMLAQHLLGRGGEDDIKAARDVLLLAAAQKSPHADYLLATIEFARGEAGWGEGKRHLRLAAGLGHLHALKLLGRVYEEGLFGEMRDATEAAGWYRKAAETGDGDASFLMGRFYARGEGVPQNLLNATRWFERSAKTGNPLAQFNYAVLAERVEIDSDNAEAGELLAAAAGQGLAVAQFRLGVQLLSDPAQRAEAHAWLEKAAAQNLAEALSLLGRLAAWGDATRPDRERAHEMLGRAVAAGHVASNLHLALLRREDGADAAAVRPLILAAAEAGVAEAAYLLAGMYASGEGVTASEVDNLTWLRRAGELGYAQALFELGIRFCRGDGVDQDIEIGTDFYRRAAEAGHVTGKYNYAILVLNARVEGDVTLARQFLEEAAASGLEEAVQAKAKLVVQNAWVANDA